MISKETATDIAMAYREIETAENLLDQVREEVEKRFAGKSDLRDVFGRDHRCLQLGVPSGETSQRLFNVQYNLAIPVIEAHIGECRAKLVALNAVAASELAMTESEQI